jgi:hypothetical protein
MILRINSDYLPKLSSLGGIVTREQCVFCEVGTDLLNIVCVDFVFQWCMSIGDFWNA